MSVEVRLSAISNHHRYVILIPTQRNGENIWRDFVANLCQFFHLIPIGLHSPRPNTNTMDPLFSYLLGYGGLPGGFNRRRGSSKKPKKQPKENWFERLTIPQNKELCKAAKLRYGGSKKELIDRLLAEPQTSKYGPEGHHIGINVEMLKGMCRERNLQVTGAKYDLVLRILHCDNNSTPEGATLKRAATDVVSTVDAVSGEVVEKRVPKKRKKAAPSASRIYTRVEKKIEAVKQKKYQVRHCFCLLIYNYYYRAFFRLI